jgi:prepilin-type N-terminal cleavage/methylation domain-containing protein
VTAGSVIGDPSRTAGFCHCPPREELQVRQLLHKKGRRVLVGAGETMTRKPCKGDAGFTLVESMMAIVILGLSLSACVISFTMSMQAVKTAANQMAALHSARYELETLRTLSLTNSSSLNSGTYSFTNGTTIGTYTVSNLNSCTRNLTVNVPYRNYINHSITNNIATNSLATTLTSTLHP